MNNTYSPKTSDEQNLLNDYIIARRLMTQRTARESQVIGVKILEELYHQHIDNHSRHRNIIIQAQHEIGQALTIV